MKKTLPQKIYEVLNSSQKSKTPANNVDTCCGKTDGLPEGRTEPKKTGNPLGTTEKNPNIKKRLFDEMDKGTLDKKHPKEGYQ